MNLPIDPVVNLVELVRCPSVTPEEAGVLAALTGLLEPMGLDCRRQVFDGPGSDPVDNLYASLRGDGPHLLFAGHTDVVPAGDLSAWTHPPFAARIEGGELFGRGAVDMKGGIACFVAALARYIERNGKPAGSVSLLITNDEEGPAVNGTVRLLADAAERGERWDAAIVGEPTCRERVGDVVKIGRRGSLSGVLTVYGRQGHVAYPHLADNPVRAMIRLAEALLYPALDDGSERFQPSNLEITSIDTGNPSANVIPAAIRACFNIRFNDRWTAASLQAAIGRRLEDAAAKMGGRRNPVRFSLEWREPPGSVFLTHDETLISNISRAVQAIAGIEPELSTSGGTSDARFIKDYCPVIEFGLVGRTMHMVDERVALDDLETLTRIYQQFIESWFASAGSA